MNKPFWQVKKLEELSREEWESLCDGCARCCLVKLEDADTGENFYTDVGCHLLDHESCRCTDYVNRSTRVPTCVKVSPETLPEIAHWMPPTCAYRLLYEGSDLRWWHPLVSGDKETVHVAGISVRGRIFCETKIPEEDQEDHVVEWPLWDALEMGESGD
ncbi:YcgN family cysteine cluster protein [bacterium AH-315-P15]|nr:YcgN family cysteine cluster protein [bacterium AH-315-P15]